MFFKKNGIKQINSAPYHPLSNGQAEQAVRSFKDKLKSGNIEVKLSRLLFNYRIIPHSFTGESPGRTAFQQETAFSFNPTET